MTGGQNKYYQLFAGFTFAIAGKAQDVTALNQCVPKSWQTVDESPVNDSEPTPSKETLTKVIDGIENLVNFVCTFKDNIIEELSESIKKHSSGKASMLVETGGIESSIKKKIQT